ncbi:unnamed protein product [Rotaria sordida]|uniref:Uncharacterized protein n=1 Tax=Rotaria sordida TaxID=392033 RepID=A0A815FJB5_9BILA|nr:unnamed protein product [Rotaria sordida]
MLKLRHNQRQQYLHLSLTTDKQLDQLNILNYCLEIFIKSTNDFITNCLSTTTNTINQSINGLIKFPVDFFESSQLLTLYEFGERHLASSGFTLEVINKDRDNKIMRGVRIHIRLYSMDK